MFLSEASRDEFYCIKQRGYDEDMKDKEQKIWAKH